ncbi:MAG TPA: hypothetical protein VFC63_24590, partial [Blastocatellia bacterium]|nr:hypothetical protein [Blastocatellia bacterium]
MVKRIGLLTVSLSIIFCLMIILRNSIVSGFINNAVDHSSDSLVETTLYDKDPHHLWNRIHQHFFIRIAHGKVYGEDELDPLFWAQTKYLRSGASNKTAISLLDEFLSSNGERLITDPLKRAMLQRDLWAVFDWLHRLSPDERELSSRLAGVIKRLALPSDQIRALPDSYGDAIASKTFPADANAERPDDAFLPPDLFAANGSWVRIIGDAEKPVAPTHFGVSSRSFFSVFMRLPGGKRETRDYLKKLNSFPNPIIKSPYFKDQMAINPEVPRFPVGTEFALVRHMMLIGDKGNLVPTRIVESVQLRVYRKLIDGFDAYANSDRFVDKFEIRLRRSLLFAGKFGGLESIRNELFNQFMSHGLDPFEMNRNSPDAVFARDPSRPFALQVGCSVCHDN